MLWCYIANVHGGGNVAIQPVKTTIYLEPELLEYLHNSAKLNEMSVSRMLNDILRERLGEHTEDLAAFEERKDELGIPFKDFVKQLKDEKLID
jgi:hypothetical protein